MVLRLGLILSLMLALAACKEEVSLARETNRTVNSPAAAKAQIPKDETDVVAFSTEPFGTRYYYPGKQNAPTTIGHRVTADGLGRFVPRFTPNNFAYLSYGPFERFLPEGAYLAHFLISIDDNWSDDSAVAVLEVVDITTASTVKTSTLTRRQFISPNVAQTFTLPFQNPFVGHTFEFRLMVNGNSFVIHRLTSVRKLEPQVTFKASFSVKNDLTPRFEGCTVSDNNAHAGYSAACRFAIHILCRDLGMDSGFPIQNIADSISVACVNTIRENSAATFGTLSTQDTRLTNSDYIDTGAYSVAMEEAATRTCRAMIGVSNDAVGWIVGHNGTRGYLTYVCSQPEEVHEARLSDLQELHPACRPGTFFVGNGPGLNQIELSKACIAAIDTYCSAKGKTTGQYVSLRNPSDQDSPVIFSCYK